MKIGRTSAIVDLRALEWNVRQIRSSIPEGRLLTGVLKADAYGHGAAACYPVLKRCGVNRYAVAMWQEGAALRKAGITEPVLILGDTPDDQMDKLLEYDLIPAVFTLDMAQRLNEVCAAAAVREPHKIHIKIDTGMGRIGFPCTAEAADTIVQIASLPYIEVEGIFSHFARADEADKSAASLQAERYHWMIGELRRRGLEIPIRHLENSAAIMEYHQEDTTMSRAGIILYGLYPSDEMNREAFPLKPVVSWHASISFVKEVPAGTPISYGGTFVTDRPSVIATVPVGYADGFNRLLSNRWEVIVHGKKARIAGRVCMDQFMIDVTDIPDVRRGDEVILLGPENTADMMAEICGTINYEIVCDISSRVPRIYTEG